MWIIRYFSIGYMRIGLTSSTISCIISIIIISNIIIIISTSLVIGALPLPPPPIHPAPHVNRSEILICHISPISPANRQTITIDSSSIRTYIRNHPGDTVGPCIRVTAAALPIRDSA
jgi:hypothetical protein